ncbi:MAG: hypothetical protein HY744_12650 [Deltaproteobacteria bacterium]|nr:hypothetical protein [Deltaproteobacteria bacterium]
MEPRLALACSAASILLACGDLGLSDGSMPDGGAARQSVYVVPDSLDELEGEHFFDHPWPSDLRIEGSFPRFAGFPNPRQLDPIAAYIEATKGLAQGFSPVGPGYLRFEVPLDPASLPHDPLQATSPSSSVQLLDIDPASPEHGTRRLVSLSFRAAGGMYVVPNTLRFMPTLGFPLRPATRYALVVTSALRDEAGAPFAPSAHLRQVLGLDPPDGPAREQARTALQDAIDEIEAADIPADLIAHLAVFTTGDPVEELRSVQQQLRAEVEPPDFYADRWEEPVTKGKLYDEYLGWYGPLPNYQEGKLPFAQNGDGGFFNFVDGTPEPVDYFDARFSLTVPKAEACPVPPDGYPIVLVAHGTGGDYRSHLDFAGTLANRCICSMGVDQIFHGERPGAPDDPVQVALLFFNFQNVIAARTNGRQSALDEVQRARLFTETKAVIPASVSATGKPIGFDGSRVLFFGHSQGGLNGPLYLALDDSARGGVLSGSGSVIGLALLEKTKPEPSIPDLVKNVLLGLPPENYDEFDLYHPAIALAQWLIDPLDAVNYARLTVREPLEGLAPKSIYMTEGIGPDGVGDSYAPPKGTEAQAIAMGLPLQIPPQHPIVELAWGGPGQVQVPPEGLCGNLAEGQASGVLAQFAPAPGEDGHFVVYDVPEARAQAAEFLRALADDPKGCVPAP